jgi:hypothetical protein
MTRCVGRRPMDKEMAKRGHAFVRYADAPNVARGMRHLAAVRVTGNGRCWSRNSAMAIHIALPNALFDKRGVPRLGP